MGTVALEDLMDKDFVLTMLVELAACPSSTGLIPEPDHQPNTVAIMGVSN